MALLCAELAPAYRGGAELERALRGWTLRRLALPRVRHRPPEPGPFRLPMPDARSIHRNTRTDFIRPAALSKVTISSVSRM